MHFKSSKSSISYRPRFPGEFYGEHLSGAVQSHLLVLNLFHAILKYVKENGDVSLQGSREKMDCPQRALDYPDPVRIKAFLVNAEARYVMYLDLVTTEAADATLLLPPWDVAMIFHSHMLSPLRFEADIGRSRWKLDNKRLKFPLERLALLISNRSWSDPESQNVWQSAYANCPYQVLSSFPDSHTTLTPYQRLEGIFVCPKCGSTPTVDFNLWATFRLGLGGEHGRLNNSSLRLPCCSFVGGYHTVCDLNLKNEICECNGMPDPSLHVKGLHPLLSSEDENRSVRALLESPEALQKREPATIDHGKLGTLMSHDAPWFWKIYHSTPWPDFSLDLVNAVLRQAQFIKKIAKKPQLEFGHSEEQYFKFMHLIKGTTTTLVPSLDIDLVWHTHQLFGADYHQFCIENIGRRINHDDTLNLGEISEALQITKEVWRKTYREEYRMGEYVLGTFKSPTIICEGGFPYHSYNSATIPTTVPDSTAQEVNKIFDEAHQRGALQVLKKIEALCQFYEDNKEEAEELIRLETTAMNYPISPSARMLTRISKKLSPSEVKLKLSDIDRMQFARADCIRQLDTIWKEISRYRKYPFGIIDKLEHARLWALYKIASSQTGGYAIQSKNTKGQGNPGVDGIDQETKIRAELMACESPLASAWLNEVIESKGWPWWSGWSYYKAYYYRTELEIYDRYANGPPPVPIDDSEGTGGIGGGCCGCG